MQQFHGEFYLPLPLVPVFFVLLETGALKGFRAAFVFDLGVIVGDVFFILVAYFSTNQILEKLKDDPGLFIFGGAILLSYGVISYVKQRRDYLKKKRRMLILLNLLKRII